ncbi:hypothetical protein EG327_009078 [Venturia inaequalis]|uniref:Uncharacterized protein n=1 Tax=Venturia inaequalis TaxID=5025 RepID=A0A8H3YYF1_VENIN|nr:hypothetical protein EG327_009078 [Venturia inaequalis]
MAAMGVIWELLVFTTAACAFVGAMALIFLPFYGMFNGFTRLRRNQATGKAFISDFSKSAIMTGLTLIFIGLSDFSTSGRPLLNMASGCSIYEIIQDTDLFWGSPLAEEHNEAEVEESDEVES